MRRCLRRRRTRLRHPAANWPPGLMPRDGRPRGRIRTRRRASAALVRRSGGNGPPGCGRTRWTAIVPLALRLAVNGRPGRFRARWTSCPEPCRVGRRLPPRPIRTVRRLRMPRGRCFPRQRRPCWRARAWRDRCLRSQPEPSRPRTCAPTSLRRRVSIRPPRRPRFAHRQRMRPGRRRWRPIRPSTLLCRQRQRPRCRGARLCRPTRPSRPRRRSVNSRAPCPRTHPGRCLSRPERLRTLPRPSGLLRSGRPMALRERQGLPKGQHPPVRAQRACLLRACRNSRPPPKPPPRCQKRKILRKSRSIPPRPRLAPTARPSQMRPRPRGMTWARLRRGPPCLRPIRPSQLSPPAPFRFREGRARLPTGRLREGLRVWRPPQPRPTGLRPGPPVGRVRSRRRAGPTTPLPCPPRRTLRPAPNRRQPGGRAPPALIPRLRGQCPRARVQPTQPRRLPLLRHRGRRPQRRRPQPPGRWPTRPRHRPPRTRPRRPSDRTGRRPLRPWSPPEPLSPGPIRWPPPP
ncbi:Hypothetical Protein RSKD131_1372 [Cereibacter sphaeroides KD131]|nr:Hypothetical Protein RSKD131_1372 [Cereibacter sphaeroides KD131]